MMLGLSVFAITFLPFLDADFETAVIDLRAFAIRLFAMCSSPQPNGPTRNTMLTIAKTPISSRISAVINVSDTGNLLCA